MIRPNIFFISIRVKLQNLIFCYLKFFFGKMTNVVGLPNTLFQFLDCISKFFGCFRVMVYANDPIRLRNNGVFEPAFEIACHFEWGITVHVGDSVVNALYGILSFNFAGVSL